MDHAQGLEEELALMLLPLGGDPKRKQVAGLAEALDLETWDAARLLSGALPRILRSAPPARIKELARQLQPLGLPISALETSLLLEDVEEWLVEWLEYGDDGKLMMVGAEGSVPLKVNQAALLVRGWEMRRSSPFGIAGTKGSGSLRQVQFAHLYVPGESRPYCLVESEIRDYLFLEEEIGPSARQNFNRLLEILASAPFMRVEDAMLQHPLEVRAALEGLTSREGSSASTAGLTLAVVPEHVVSRMYFYNTF